jgi:hypothetical protein
MADRDAFLSVGVQVHPGIEAHRRVLPLLRRKTPAHSASLHISHSRVTLGRENAVKSGGGASSRPRRCGGLSTARLAKRVLGPRIGAGEHAPAPWPMSSTGMPMSGEP